MLGRFEAAQATTTRFPMQPPRALWEIRQALGREDILISDVGLHKLWIGRMFPAHEPNTVLIANGLAGMGFAMPCAIAAKLVHPSGTVVTVNGDGGFLMNCQELETAMRLRRRSSTSSGRTGSTARSSGSRTRSSARHFGVDFTNPDFVQARRVVRAAGVALRGGRGLRRAPAPRARRSTCPSLIVLPIDYSIDVAISRNSERETVAT